MSFSDLNAILVNPVGCRRGWVGIFFSFFYFCCQPHFVSMHHVLISGVVRDKIYLYFHKVELCPELEIIKTGNQNISCHLWHVALHFSFIFSEHINTFGKELGYKSCLGSCKQN